MRRTVFGPETNHCEDGKKWLLNSYKNTVPQGSGWTYLNKHGSILYKFKEVVPHFCKASVTVDGV
jgi:hypothetical protein